jgi:hypothetical protein
MAITGRVPTTFDTNKFIPEIFSKNVLVAVKNNLVATPRFNHSFEADLKMGDTLYITATNTVSASEITVGKELPDANAFNTSAVTLSINQYWGAKHTIDVMSRRQSQVNLIGEAEKENAYAVEKKIDSTVCALFSALHGGSVAGTDGGAWTDDVLIAAVEYLDEADAPEKDRVWISDPSVKADILKIDKFVRMDYNASDATVTGMFRKDIYGAPLLVTNNLTAVTSGTGSYGVYAHKDAIAIAISENPNSFMVEQPLLHQVVLETDALWVWLNLGILLAIRYILALPKGD